MNIQIKSFGHYIPKARITNAELAGRFSLEKDWIFERVGIEERAIYNDGPTSDMALAAAINCLEKANIKPEDLDCIILATITPDHHCPSTASIVHHKLGAGKAWAFDIAAACSGFIYGLNLASSLIQTHKYQNVLVIGADKMTSIIDKNDKKTTLLLGDAAGACLLGYSSDKNQISDITCELYSTNWADVTVPHGGSFNPSGEDRYLRFLSKENFRNGVTMFVRSITEALIRNNLSINDIDYIAPHQSNKRMLEAIAEELSFPIQKFLLNVECIGNTSAASIPVLISRALDERKLKGHETLLLTSVGAGFTIGSAIIKL